MTRRRADAANCLLHCRNIKDGPFCWQSKAVRRRIREAFDATNNVATALVVYDALTEIASNEQAETFTAAHAYIAIMCGVSPRTVQRHLKGLAALGLLSIETPALLAPSRFTLLAFGNHGVTLGNDGATNGNHDGALRHSSKQPLCPTVEESNEKSQKNGLKKFCTEPAVPASGPAPAALEFPVVGATATEWLLLESKVAEYRSAFPSLDVLAECRKARQWVVDNPTRRKTLKGMPKFLFGWLERSQNRGVGASQRQPPSEKSLAKLRAPENWRELMRIHYPGNIWSDEPRDFESFPRQTQQEIIAAIQRIPLEQKREA